MRYPKASLVIFLVAATFVAGCGRGDENQPTVGAGISANGSKDGKQGRAEPPRPVRVIEVGMSNLGDISYLPGDVRPRYEQRYGFRIGGKIARRLVDVGDSVQANQVLAVLDSQDVMPAIDAQSAHVDAAHSDFKLQQSELKRLQDLRDKGFVSGAALERQVAATDAARSRQLAAQSQLVNAQNALNFQTLRADMSGVVVAVDAEAGSVVAAGQAVVRVAQLGEKEFVVNVSERDVALMKKASGFSATLDALGDRIYAAKLRELSPVADAASRTYAARLAIIKADEALKLGMSARVRMEFGSAQVIVVPNSALYTRDDTTRVWLVDRASETVKPTAVQIGESTADGVTILSGLKPGDLVVTAGANLLLPGQKVRLLRDTPSPASSGQITRKQ